MHARTTVSYATRHPSQPLSLYASHYRTPNHSLSRSLAARLGPRVDPVPRPAVPAAPQQYVASYTPFPKDNSAHATRTPPFEVATKPSHAAVVPLAEPAVKQTPFVKQAPFVSQTHVTQAVRPVAADGRPPSEVPCRFFPLCRRPNCHFFHPTSVEAQMAVGIDAHGGVKCGI